MDMKYLEAWPTVNKGLINKRERKVIQRKEYYTERGDKKRGNKSGGKNNRGEMWGRDIEAVHTL
jgi:hypothetical protein